MHKTRLVLIEDEEDVAAMIKLQAEIFGFKLYVETDGLAGLRAVERERPDLVLLDLMLPKMSGLDVCRRMKNHPELRSIPLIMISARNEELDVLLGLELGADDYVTKPFSPKILFSRIKAVLRRARDVPKIAGSILFGDFVLEVDRYMLQRKGHYIPITLSEFGILRRMLVNRGKVLTRNQLLDDMQHEDAVVVDRNIDVHIASLRRKLGPHFHWIETVRGVGYRFREEIREDHIEEDIDLHEDGFIEGPEG